MFWMRQNAEMADSDIQDASNFYLNDGNVKIFVAYPLRCGFVVWLDC